LASESVIEEIQDLEPSKKSMAIATADSIGALVITGTVAIEVVMAIASSVVTTGA
jgi:hypothetical protein